MAMVNSMKLEESCCLSCPLMRLQYITLGLEKVTSISRHGDILKSHMWHCIDYAIMRTSHRRRCLDVSVTRGADCNTDHRMIRMKLIVGRKSFYKRRCKESSMRRWDVARCKGTTEDA